MTRIIRAEGAVLDQILDAAHRLRHEGLDRQAYGKLDAALHQTAWGRRSSRRFALVDGTDMLATAEQYDLEGCLDGHAVRVCGIGAVLTSPAHHGLGHAPALVETLLAQAARAGVTLAMLFPHQGMDEDVRTGFEPLPAADVTLDVAESARHGAPMTMIRGGEERDLAAIVAMGRTRAEPFRFHLHRDVDFVQHAIARQRLLAGLGPSGARQLHFFIAEEGITAAAYVVIGVEGRAWTIEECGDRDPSGARVGAMLQGLIARDRVERPLSIRGWLPPGFAPSQVRVVSATPAPDTVLTRALGASPKPASFRPPDVLYWRNDLF